MEKRESLRKIEKLNLYTNNIKDFSTFIGKHTLTSKIGICKINCMHKEDYKEKLVRDILKSLNINSSEIEFLRDEFTNNDAYISYYNICEDEMLMTPYKSVNVYEDMSFEFNRKDELQRFLDEYIEGVRAFNGIPYTKVKEAKQNAINMIFLDVLLDNFNRDFSNMQLAYNKKTGEYKILEWYGYSNALDKESVVRSGPFFKMTSVEVLEKLFENYYSLIEPIYNKVTLSLDNNKIRELFLQDYVIDNFNSEYIALLQSNMQNNLDMIKEKKEVAYKKIIVNKKINEQNEKIKQTKKENKKEKKVVKEKKNNIAGSIKNIINKFKEILQSSKVMRLNSAAESDGNIYNYNFLNGDSIEVILGSLEPVENKKLRKVEVTKFYQNEFSDNYTQDIEKSFYIDDYAFSNIDVETICNFFNKVYDDSNIGFFSGLRYIKSTMLDQYIYSIQNNVVVEEMKIDKVGYVTRENFRKKKR